jgi:hypothetical protein
MADYIMTAGSCLKSNIYKTIRDAMIAAGWQDVSSLASTDFSVMYSPGKDGSRALYLQMRPQNYVGTNSVETTDYSHISFRMLDTYTPGAAGVAGTIPRNANAWYDLALIQEAYTGVTVPQTSTIDYRLYVDLNKVVFLIIPPSSYGLYPILHFIGLPDTLFANEPLSRGMIWAGSYLSAHGTAQTITVSNTPGGVAAAAAPYTEPLYCQLAPKNPNAAGAYSISEIYYGNTTEGIRGKIDGIYALPYQNIVNGDILTIGTSKYQVIYGPGPTSFPTTAIAIKIE